MLYTMLGRNLRILRSIVSGWVSLLSRVCFCIAGSIIGVNGYLESIYSCPMVKVTQGHACHGPFPWLTSAVKNSNITAILSLRVILLSRNAIFGIIAYELTISDATCTYQGQPSSSEVI